MTNHFHTHTHTKWRFYFVKLGLSKLECQAVPSSWVSVCQKHVESGFFSQRTFLCPQWPFSRKEGRAPCSKLVLCWLPWSVVIKGMDVSLFSVKSMVKGPQNWIHLFNMWTYRGFLLWEACHQICGKQQAGPHPIEGETQRHSHTLPWSMCGCW